MRGYGVIGNGIIPEVNLFEDPVKISEQDLIVNN
jgi:hypothetical protein